MRVARMHPAQARHLTGGGRPGGSGSVEIAGQIGLARADRDLLRLPIDVFDAVDEDAPADPRGERLVLLTCFRECVAQQRKPVVVEMQRMRAAASC